MFSEIILKNVFKTTNNSTHTKKKQIDIFDANANETDLNDRKNERDKDRFVLWIQTRNTHICIWSFSERKDHRHRRRISHLHSTTLDNWKKRDSLEVLNVLSNRNVYTHTHTKPKENPCPINAAINFNINFPSTASNCVLCVCVCPVKNARTSTIPSCISHVCFRCRDFQWLEYNAAVKLNKLLSF